MPAILTGTETQNVSDTHSQDWRSCISSGVLPPPARLMRVLIYQIIIRPTFQSKRRQPLKRASSIQNLHSQPRHCGFQRVPDRNSVNMTGTLRALFSEDKSTWLRKYHFQNLNQKADKLKLAGRKVAVQFFSPRNERR